MSDSRAIEPAGGATAAAEARRAREGVEPEDLYDRPERRSKVDAASDYSFGRTGCTWVG
ncbi:hypothetical protein Esi_0032_0114 [Ectocarpus siliculosus]|uniref:Uncharacterized protein n=1 Tax=Ectocarpus siliculosus TaxID=2880 RepID=D7FX55_ECTSI|nr:hypothetical protein Esi_0032_0114 [Ectocarpus siliculosus]|eukprot:CBJ26388.1 hypothetical protein Esi_0032_0114 [Ectocarpus siliculosus]